MKKTMIGLLISLWPFMLTAQSYQRKTPEEKAKKYTQEMMTEIPLDAEQEPAIYAINLRVSRQFDSLYASHPGQEVLRPAMISIFRNRDTALRAILSPQQFLRFDDLQREKRKKRLEQKQQEKAAEKRPE